MSMQELKVNLLDDAGRQHPFLSLPALEDQTNGTFFGKQKKHSRFRSETEMEVLQSIKEEDPQMRKSQDDLKGDEENLDEKKDHSENELYTNRAVEDERDEKQTENDKNSKLEKNDKTSGGGKLLDFVEVDDTHSPENASMNNTNILPKLSQANLHRLSQFHNTLLNNRQSKLNKTKQSLYLASGLNLNYEEVLQDAVEVEDGKLIVQVGDQVRKITIGPNMMKYLGEDTEQHVNEISKPLYTRINHYLAWFLVFYATINGACIPPWIMSIPAEKYMRISWRFFMQTIMMIPFLMYEKRNLSPENKQQYTLSYIFKLEHIKKVYLVAFTNSIWFTMVLFAFEWNFISHALVLSGLQQFFFSIQRHIRKEENHSYEAAGQAMVVFGLICVFTSSIYYDPDEAPPSTRNYRNYLLLLREPWQRLVIGNFQAILVSYLMFKMAKHQGESRKVYPQFLSMALVFFFTSINMTMSSYFFAGSDLVHIDSFWGWMGLFSTTQFSGFLYMSIILGMGNFVTQTLISKIFEPIIPATVALFEPIFSTLILQLVGVQIIPGGLSCIGYIFIVPGLFVIVLGQHLLSIKYKQEEEENIKKQLEEEVKRLQKLQEDQKLEEEQRAQNLIKHKQANDQMQISEDVNKRDLQGYNSEVDLEQQSQNQKSFLKIDGLTPKQSENKLKLSDNLSVTGAKYSINIIKEMISEAKDSLKAENLLKQPDSPSGTKDQEDQELTKKKA